VRHAGDIILKVNGEDVTKHAVKEVVKLIKGEQGTRVSLHVRRGVGEIAMHGFRARVWGLGIGAGEIGHARV
jgi:C-terminal processing protease CtpA/Prc